MEHVVSQTHRELAVVLDEIAGEIGQEARLSLAEPGSVLTLCLARANQFDQDYQEANQRADHEDADLVDTVYMDDHLVYPLKKATKLRRLALELIIDHQILSDQTLQIPAQLFRDLIQEAYSLALEVHDEDVPEYGCEERVIGILAQIKKQVGIEPDVLSDRVPLGENNQERAVPGLGMGPLE